MKLDADDRTGSSAAGETMFINLDHTADIRRILVFAFIYDGVPAWDQANAVVTLYRCRGRRSRSRSTRPGRCPHVRHRDAAEHRRRPHCLARGAYIDGAQDKLDAAYGWGLDWRPGRK